MPIYSLMYLNTSTIELNPICITAWGACILRSSSGCQEHVLQSGRGSRDPRVLLWPLLVRGRQRHPSVHIGHSYVTF